jgi:NADPH:quinone reductase
MVTAFARIEGKPIGIVANNPAPPLRRHRLRRAADKAARFMQLCDAFDIPMLFPLRHARASWSAPPPSRPPSSATSPPLRYRRERHRAVLLSVVLRKAYGLGAMAMAGGSFKANGLTVAWPTGEFGGMGLEGMVRLGSRDELAYERKAIEDPEAARRGAGPHRGPRRRGDLPRRPPHPRGVPDQAGPSVHPRLRGRRARPHRPEGSGFSAGDRVAAFPAFGGFAELVAVDPALVFDLPDGVSSAAAAGIPMNYLTMHFGLVRRGQLRAGETVLVHGAAGGIGTASIQLARALDARVIAVVSTEEKGEVAKQAGAHEVVLADGFKDAVKELTGGRGVDLIVDPVGGDRFTDSLRSLAVEGRLLVIGFTGGEIPTVKVNRLLLNNISVVGVGWGAFWLPRPGYLREQWAEVRPLVESGAIDPPLGSSHALEDAAAALREIDERRATGKVVLTVRES